jgi:hypothetical protein
MQPTAADAIGYPPLRALWLATFGPAPAARLDMFFDAVETHLAALPGTSEPSSFRTDL